MITKQQVTEANKRFAKATNRAELVDKVERAIGEITSYPLERFWISKGIILGMMIAKDKENAKTL